MGQLQSIEDSTRFTMTLTTRQAEILKELIKNPITSDEGYEIFNFRKVLFNAIELQLGLNVDDTICGQLATSNPKLKKVLEKVQQRYDIAKAIPKKDGGNVYTTTGGDSIITERTLKEVLNIIHGVINEN